MKSLRKIENAIAQLPPEAQAQLVRDMPALCPSAFPADGWDAILADSRSRPALSSLLDRLDTDYAAAPEKFVGVNEETLREPPKR